MLVTKVKAINQWMECKSCKLQQVKSITPQSRRIECVSIAGNILKKFGSIPTEKLRGGGPAQSLLATITKRPWRCGASPGSRYIDVRPCLDASARSACHVETGHR
jgi:hypothetical protein